MTARQPHSFASGGQGRGSHGNEFPRDLGFGGGLGGPPVNKSGSGSRGAYRGSLSKGSTARHSANNNNGGNRGYAGPNGLTGQQRRRSRQGSRIGSGQGADRQPMQPNGHFDLEPSRLPAVVKEPTHGRRAPPRRSTTTKTGKAVGDARGQWMPAEDFERLLSASEYNRYVNPSSEHSFAAALPSRVLRAKGKPGRNDPHSSNSGRARQAPQPRAPPANDGFGLFIGGSQVSGKR